jgi:hypothetical protein
VDLSDGEDDTKFKLNTALADEKELAIDTLGELLENTRQCFLPYVEKSCELLLKQCEHFGEGVRKAAISTMFTFLKTCYVLSGPTQWIAGLPNQVPVHDTISAMLNAFIPAILAAWADEDEKDVVIILLQEYADTLKLLGPVAIAGHEQTVLQNVQEIYEKKAYCQQDQGDDEGILDEDEQAERESQLKIAASDMLGALAIALGAQFTQAMNVFMPYLTKYYKPSKSLQERSMAIGTLSEVISGMKQVDAVCETLYHLFLKAMSDPEDEVRSNACYGMGVLIEYATVDMSGQYATVLQSIQPFFQNQQLPNLTDNACGCLARMIMKQPTAMPLDQVLPVLLSALPLKADYQENEPVYKCIMGLARAQDPTILANLGTIKSLMASVLQDANDVVKEDTRADMTQFLSN